MNMLVRFFESLGNFLGKYGVTLLTYGSIVFSFIIMYLLANINEQKKSQSNDSTELPIKGFEGRTGDKRTALLMVRGGNAETEAAVARGLEWIAAQQIPAGNWEFDEGREGEVVAATGMGLLPFLAAGETHKSGTKYSPVVAKAANWLIGKVDVEGHIGSAGNYANAIACIALCELAGMSQDPLIKAKAQLAVNYIVSIQADDGSWGYGGKHAGDTSIVGWQLQALWSARTAGLIVPDATWEEAYVFLDRVSSESGSKYGYRTPGGSERMSAVGLLCHQYMGWTRVQPGLAKGVEWLWKGHKPTVRDMYYTYYATQVFHFFDGPQWHRDWNPAMQAALLPAQITEKTPDAKPQDIGSWNPDGGSIGSACGRLGTTALCVLSLQVYYRYSPFHRDYAPVDAEVIYRRLREGYAADRLFDVLDAMEQKDRYETQQTIYRSLRWGEGTAGRSATLALLNEAGFKYYPIRYPASTTFNWPQEPE